MRRLLTLLLAALLVAPLTAPAPARAEWVLAEPGKPVIIGKTTMRVTPSGSWNRPKRTDSGMAENWTRDGIVLNDLFIVAGMPEGWSLFESPDEEERPMPTMPAQLDIVEIPEFYESSARLALSTSVFTITSTEPATMDGFRAIRFTFEYAFADSPLKRRGVAVGTVVMGKLYLIAYDGPATYFFDRDLPDVEAMIASVKLS